MFKSDKQLKIAIDFDGTCVTHDFPNVGKDIGAAKVIKQLSDKGHKIILYTMRDEQYLKDAKMWFEYNNIPLYSTNIDTNLSYRPFVDWIEVEKILKQKGIL